MAGERRSRLKKNSAEKATTNDRLKAALKLARQRK
jgi:hypothetical protein